MQQKQQNGAGKAIKWYRKGRKMMQKKARAGLSRREKNEIKIVFLLKHDIDWGISLKHNDLGYTCDRCDSKNH